MIDPKSTLPITLYANKGAYALLIGSGVSRSAGILTSWEIVIDLIRQLSLMGKEDCGEDPEKWFVNKYGEQPSYSNLLEQIAKTPSERRQLLRGYFEPTEEERDQGIKLPKQAHDAIAEMVKKGYIKVIVTTNFDKLLEGAIESKGITPIVISTPDAAEGALPVGQEKCTIIKVHGDYLDTRIKNTPSELENYDDRINGLLDRVFDEYGLIVCGWSAEWDAALRGVLQRCKTHRFTTYWTLRSEPGLLAKQLINERKAEVVRISDSDSFFWEIKEKVIALENLEGTHPLNMKVAVERLKSYIAEDRYYIKLNDLVMREVEDLYERLSLENYPSEGIDPSPKNLDSRLTQYEKESETLIYLLINGCRWGKGMHEDLWVKVIERIGNPNLMMSGYDSWIYLRLYPALLLIYASGITSVASGNYRTFASLMTKPRIYFSNEEQPAVLALCTIYVMELELQRKMPGQEGQHTPLSNRLFKLLREPLREILLRDDQYDSYFDRFEYLYGIVHLDLLKKKSGEIWLPMGRFGWNRRRRDSEKSIMSVIDKEVQASGNRQPYLGIGLFDDDITRFMMIKNFADQWIGKNGWI